MSWFVANRDTHPVFAHSTSVISFRQNQLSVPGETQHVNVVPVPNLDFATAAQQFFRRDRRKRWLRRHCHDGALRSRNGTLSVIFGHRPADWFVTGVCAGLPATSQLLQRARSDIADVGFAVLPAYGVKAADDGLSRFLELHHSKDGIAANDRIGIAERAG